VKILLFCILLFIFTVSALVGKVNLDFMKIFEPGSMEYQIFMQIRLPRVLLAFFSGGILALSGLLFQTLFRNPLTTPFTLGISSGATLGAAVAIMMGLGGGFLGFSFVTLFGFLGAFSTVLMIYIFSRKLPSSSDQRLILVGIALSFLYSAVLLVVYYLSDFQESYLILRFTMGSLLTVGYSDIVPVVLGAAVILFAALRFRDELKLFSVSDEFAFLKGVDVTRVLMVLFIVISLSVGMLVSIVGPISFIGLIIPHMVRSIMKKSIEHTIVPVFMTGGLFLLLCDTIARTLPTVSEIPVGIITSLIGGTLFVWILLRKKGAI
jgi:iron complex transport system permease protein